MNTYALLLIFELPVLAMLICAYASLRARWERDHEKLDRIIAHLGFDPEQWL